MKSVYQFNLERPARKGGSDRYEAQQDENFKIYIPQSISRPAGNPLVKIDVTFSVDE